MRANSNSISSKDFEILRKRQAFYSRHSLFQCLFAYMSANKSTVLALPRAANVFAEREKEIIRVDVLVFASLVQRAN